MSVFFEKGGSVFFCRGETKKIRKKYAKNTIDRKGLRQKIYYLESMTDIPNTIINTG